MDNKKKIAILLPWLKMGGTNKIALHFMKELSQYCDVTLVLSEYTGELLEQLPENIHLVVDTMRPFKDIFQEDLRKLRIGKLMQDVFYYGRIKAKRDSVDNYRYLVQRHGYICDTEFDCAISYHGQSPERLLNLLYRTRAKKKVAWIHGEFNNSADHYRRMNAYYSKLDHIFHISHLTLNSFLEKFQIDPSMCTVYYNPLDVDEVVYKSQYISNVGFDSQYFNLVTVGRLSYEKGQDMIPAVTRRLLDAGHQVRWYAVGDGDIREHVKMLIRKYHVEDNVILLGTQTNPYPYIKACDLYVQPSYTEGYSTTICEAGVLGKAIICTFNCGIREILEDKKDVLFVNATVDGLAGGIQTLIGNESIRRKFETEIQKKNFEGKGEIQKFLAFLDQ